MKITKKSYFDKLAKTGYAKKFYPDPHIEDKDRIIENITKQLLDQGAKEEDIILNDQEISIGNQFWYLPRYSKFGAIVKVVVRTKSIITIGSDSSKVYSDKKDWQINEMKSCLEHKNGARLYVMGAGSC